MTLILNGGNLHHRRKKKNNGDWSIWCVMKGSLVKRPLHFDATFLLACAEVEYLWFVAYFPIRKRYTKLNKCQLLPTQQLIREMMT